MGKKKNKKNKLNSYAGNPPYEVTYFPKTEEEELKEIVEERIKWLFIGQLLDKIGDADVVPLEDLFNDPKLLEEIDNHVYDYKKTLSTTLKNLSLD